MKIKVAIKRNYEYFPSKRDHIGFEVIEQLPEVGDLYGDLAEDEKVSRIEEVDIIETNSMEAGSYKFYIIHTEYLNIWDEQDTAKYYVAVEIDWEAIEAEDEYGII